MDDARPIASYIRPDGRVNYKALRRILVTAFPRAFVPSGEPKRPLAVTITQQLIKARPDIDEAAIRFFMRKYVCSRRYRQCIVEGATRFHLDGFPSSRVTAQNEAHAKGELKKMGWA